MRVRSGRECSYRFQDRAAVFAPDRKRSPQAWPLPVQNAPPALDQSVRSMLGPFDRPPATQQYVPRSADVCGHSCRSEEHTSELQSLMRISYAVFCLKKKNINKTQHHQSTNLILNK